MGVGAYGIEDEETMLRRALMYVYFLRLWVRTMWPSVLQTAAKGESGREGETVLECRQGALTSENLMRATLSNSDR